MIVSMENAGWCRTDTPQTGPKLGLSLETTKLEFNEASKHIIHGENWMEAPNIQPPGAAWWLIIAVMQPRKWEYMPENTSLLYFYIGTLRCSHVAGGDTRHAGLAARRTISFRKGFLQFKIQHNDNIVCLLHLLTVYIQCIYAGTTMPEERDSCLDELVYLPAKSSDEAL